MKTTAFVFLALLSGAALAASAVGADALFHRGEKYWYGQGVSADMAQADALFRQAVAAGSQDAQRALQLSAKRQAAMSRIDYCLHGYDGADVKLDCAKISIPAVSGPDDYKDVGGKIDAWEACYNRFVLNLNRRLSAGKMLPADLTKEAV